MNYRDLLIKYIGLVGDNEGVSFITEPVEEGFSVEEWHELRELDRESIRLRELDRESIRLRMLAYKAQKRQAT